MLEWRNMRQQQQQLQLETGSETVENEAMLVVTSITPETVVASLHPPSTSVPQQQQDEANEDENGRNKRRRTSKVCALPIFPTLSHAVTLGGLCRFEQRNLLLLSPCQGVSCKSSFN